MLNSTADEDNMKKQSLLGSVVALACAAVWAEVPPALKRYVVEDSSTLVLMHVRVIDGTGASPMEDQRIDIENGKIARVQSAKSRNALPPNAKVLDLSGKTVIPGLVGMHEHLFYPASDGGGDRLSFFSEMIDSGPRLYLAGGVTTARTAGTMEPYTDLTLKKLIDANQTPGPKLDVTGPYIGDVTELAPQSPPTNTPEDAARLVDYWATQGATSFKAYVGITAEELKVAIEHAHARGLKLTGHLCSVGFTDAVSLGIDNLEHGISVDTEFYPDKKPDVCPSGASQHFAQNVDIDSEPVKNLIRLLVERKVAVTSTLAVLEVGVPNRPGLENLIGVKAALSPEGWETYMSGRTRIAQLNDPTAGIVLKKEMQFEREFVQAGGLLMAGADPTSYGGVLPGYADQRNLELLVEAGFTPVEAIRIATLNGATFLGNSSIGSIAAGKTADLVVLNGNPARDISDVRKVQIVFKDGLGYDPAKLIQSVKGLVGRR